MELSAFEEEQVIKTEPDLNETSLKHDYSPLISIKREPDTFNPPFLSGQVEIEESMDIKTEPNCNCNSTVYVKNDEVAYSINCESHIEQSENNSMSGTMSHYLSSYSDNFGYISSHKPDNGRKNPISQYTCDLCNKKMYRKIYLKDHINRVHNMIKSHQCYLCDYECSKSSNLKRHIDSVHNKIKRLSLTIAIYVIINSLDAEILSFILTLFTIR